MTSVRQSHVTTMSSSNHDNNLDALLEELQTSVSRPGSSLGHNHNGYAGPGVTGYREVTRTVTTETAGQPPVKSSEYQIEYLTPSNTTTVLKEVSPPLRDLSLQHDGQHGRNLSSYKTVQYQYNTSTSGSGIQDGAAPGADIRMRQNITELDSLLDDLHTAQKTGFSDSGVSRHTGGIDPGLLEPLESSTPRSSHVSRSVEKRTVQEQRYGSVGQNRDRDREIRKELVFTGGSGRREQPSPTPPPPVAHKEVYHYETKTTRTGSGSRDLSPPQDRRQPSPARQLTSVRTYNYSSSDEVPRTPTMHRSPSPSGGRNSSTTRTDVRQYNYSNRDFSPEGVRQPPLRSPSPSTKVTTVRNYTYNTPQEPIRNTSSKMTTVNSYSYNSTSRDNKYPQEVPRSPPPHRSPSPVSFTPPPLPATKTTTVKTYNFDQSSSHQPYQRPQSPQPAQKFSPSDPSRTLTYQVSPPPSQPSQPTVITYKYSSQTTHSSKYPGEEGAPLLPRPFPTPSPTPEQQQQPPKKLDELMASFSDTDIQHHHESTRYMPVREPSIQRTEAPPRDAPPTPPPATGPSPASTAAAMQVKSKNIAGPPVYYPPGVELFAKKEESMMQSQSGGGKYKAKAKYEYESSSKMKSKESSGKTVVPVCLPVCCAMPCVIM